MYLACVVPALLVVAALILLYRAGPSLPPETDEIIDNVLTSKLPEIVVGDTGFAQSDGLDIWYECIPPKGASKGTVLLLMGMGGDGLFWPPAFVRAFVAAGYRTIRYDYRGTGLSDWMKDWDRHNPYTLADMAEDAIAVLDALNIPQAHLVGLSLGGMIAQEIAIAQPDRVASLTLMMTSGYIGDSDLPGLTSRYLIGSAIKGLPLLRYRLLGGEKNLIKERLAKTIVVAGIEGLDVRETAELVLYDLRQRRGLNLKATLQHQTAINIAGSRFGKLEALDAPTLVIHGTADQLIPVEHGRKLVAAIPRAEGLWLDGVGHVFPVPDMDSLMEHILRHLERSGIS
jgi:pimeloyl-ACP methyl ester carboxylesterase